MVDGSWFGKALLEKCETCFGDLLRTSALVGVIGFQATKNRTSVVVLARQA